jgi:hypothetical protein
MARATAQLMRDQLVAAGVRCVIRNRDDLSASRVLGFSAPFTRDLLVLEGDAGRAAAALYGMPARRPIPVHRRARG